MKKIKAILSALDQKLEDKNSSGKKLKVSDLLTKLYDVYAKSLENATTSAEKMITLLGIKLNEDSGELESSEGQNKEGTITKENDDFNSEDWNAWYSSMRRYLEMANAKASKKSTGYGSPDKDSDEQKHITPLDELDECNNLLTKNGKEVIFDSFRALDNETRDTVCSKISTISKFLLDEKKNKADQESTETEPEREQIQKPAENGKKSDLCEQVIK